MVFLWSLDTKILDLHKVGAALLALLAERDARAISQPPGASAIAPLLYGRWRRRLRCASRGLRRPVPSDAFSYSGCRVRCRCAGSGVGRPSFIETRDLSSAALRPQGAATEHAVGGDCDTSGLLGR